MANEESFHSLGEDRTSDLSANRKRKSKATVENGRSRKSRRWCDAEVDRLIELLEERPSLWDVFCKEYHVREKRERAYEESENELEIDLNDIKTKIVGLRSQHVAFVWPPRRTLCNIIQQCWIQQCWMMLDPFGRAFKLNAPDLN